ncbi:MAG: hypothetical protein ABI647_06685 [Gemmatimonadota bacterium]
MSDLDASFQASGKAANVVEAGDTVTIVFTRPPANATNVKVEVIETAGPNDVRRTDLSLAVFRGSITSNIFKLDPVGIDPLDTNPKPNPELPKIPLSDSPPKLSIKFDATSGVSVVPLPDKEREDLNYEIKLKITGSVAGKDDSFVGQAILKVNLTFDVMIIPTMAGQTRTQQNTHEFGILSDNAQWGKQWFDHAPARRALVELAPGASLDDFRNAIKTAAAKAAKGDVFLLVGHGGAGGFRGLNQTVFDPVPDLTSGLSNHKNTVTSDVVALEDRATRTAPRVWVTKATNPASDDKQQIDNLSRRWEAMSDAGDSLRAGNVKRFVIMACNFAKDRAFGTRLAKIMKMTIGGYDKLLAIGAEIFSNPSVTLQSAWISADPTLNPDPDRPTAASTDRNHKSFHEVPQPIQNFNP